MNSTISLDGFGMVLGGLDGWPAACGTPVAPMSQAQPEHWLVHADGRRDLLPVRRWHGPPEPAIESVVDRCAGPTIDLGCGPGRLTEALAQRGLVALGVDISAEAVRLTQGRGVIALRRDVFAPLPGEGRWSHALLIDGNIGIGGDPVRLLRRCGALIVAEGTLVVEVEPPGAGLWQGQAYVLSGSSGEGERQGPAFAWARVGVEAVGRIAVAAGLRVADRLRFGPRWFAELVRS
ncbi:class I SAM-dependent methyltransferase [Micromonospora chokoriensis]|uniref:methyltransferase domain-containing protein n=1 Tax=Micromonospora chokoriensis TaxID=356851 RepID=UPI000A71AB3D|nr:class I SAM-dependent methyltransferase [Micromonospora chokoriensis]